MNNKKEVFFSIIGVLVLFILVIGVSYAIWHRTFLGSKENSISTGYISFSYNESQTNTINIKNAIPISDVNGKLLAGKDNVFDFNVSANYAGVPSVNYEIYVTPIDQTIDSKYIKLYLTDQHDQPIEGFKEKVPSYANLKNYHEKGSKVLYKASINTSGEVADYRLRVWVSEEFNEPENSQKFSFKVNVVGVA